MERNGFEVERKVASQLDQALTNSSLTIASQDKWETPLMIRRFDFVIYKGVNPLAVIEVKSSLQTKNIIAIATDQVRSAMSITNSRFGIVTDSEQFYLYDRNNRNDDFKLVSFDYLISQLIQPEKVKVSKQDRELISRIIIDAANQYLKHNQDFLAFITGKSFLSRIEFDEQTNTYNFSDDDGGITSFENQFFNKMFGEFKDTQICRYTSINTIFEMLNNISFRMSGLVGMNDRSEVNYVESYLNQGSNEIISKPLVKEHYNTISAINNKYITSCSALGRKDDLTLWRLYSEDAKGVCLIFDVRKANLGKNVLLQKIKYADENGSHRELDFLKNIKKEVEHATGFKFEFRKLGYWKHFFKAKDYAIEEEIRLLIVDNNNLNKLRTGWLMTYTHSILNPVIDFQLNSASFPIRLKQIILGPKCPEQETNLVQLKEMIRRKRREITERNLDSNFRGLGVELSKITHYR